ncbi:MAG TPA: sigma-70 family RNA polymerase sigma factor [Thermoanaerobaculia bacterium]|nr:sigma-70 family RNA polymerase sigma factor [Thermoanaerobaculia bacterium]
MQEPRSEAKGVTPPPADAAGNGVRAFEEAYVRYAPRLRKVAVAKFGIAPDDAEGLVQDVFATYFMHAASVEQVERYLIGGICNAARKHLQRAGVADALFCGEDPCEATIGDVMLRQIERKQLLSKVLARVGSRCRDLLCRYFVRGESAAAIADTLDSTPGSVAVALHKCRKRAVDAYRAITKES